MHPKFLLEDVMGLREEFTGTLKAAMLAHDAARVSTLRMVTSRLKDFDIAARPKGIAAISDDEIVAMLRGMVKTRRESVALYKQGNRADLVAKEESEIAVIEGFLPRQMDATATEAAVAQVIAETGAASVKETGRVMAALKARHGATIDMSQVGPLVKARLAG